MEKTLEEILQMLAEGGVGLRGSHGVGKSAVPAEVAKRTGKRLLDVRLGFVTEDDIIKHVGISSFVAAGWLHSACAEPCILFFDEIERAEHNTQRMVLQLVRNRELRGWRLHPDTRIFVAVNHSAELGVRPGYPTPYSELLDALGVVR
jgi:MoxR-like ATPase